MKLTTPKTLEEWQHVYRYALLCRKINELVFRWNKIATETSIFSLKDAQSHAVIKDIKEEEIIAML